MHIRLAITRRDRQTLDRKALGGARFQPLLLCFTHVACIHGKRLRERRSLRLGVRCRAELLDGQIQKRMLAAKRNLKRKVYILCADPIPQLRNPIGSAMDLASGKIVSMIGNLNRMILIIAVHEFDADILMETIQHCDTRTTSGASPKLSI